MKKRRQSKKKRSQASLFHAAEEGMVEVVADLIKEGANVNEKNHVSLNRVLSASA